VFQSLYKRFNFFNDRKLPPRFLHALDAQVL
jgi:hypothetical protein